ncbi:MAG: hypothetical protein IE931_12775 [Sphingobacteriales bacterium]|nr:hypothetical protein [Sphingobacteriales bacterium]
MKKYLSTIFMLILGINIEAQTIIHKENSSIPSEGNGLTISNNEIKENGKLIAKYKVKKTELKSRKKEKTEAFEVQIFRTEGAMVADYEITINKNEKSNKQFILDAHINTINDRVTHNGANFLDYSISYTSETSGVPQFKKAVKYLLSLDYL